MLSSVAMMRQPSRWPAGVTLLILGPGRDSRGRHEGLARTWNLVLWTALRSVTLRMVHYRSATVFARNRGPGEISANAATCSRLPRSDDRLAGESRGHGEDGLCLRADDRHPDLWEQLPLTGAHQRCGRAAAGPPDPRG